MCDGNPETEQRNCLDVNVREDFGLDADATSTYCYDPCNLDVFTCEYLETPESEPHDCANDLNGHEYWSVKGIHDMWNMMIAKDDEWSFIYRYWQDRVGFKKDYPNV